jgi:threonine dehydrogenase-like Zn-dependent dehydrogenase
LTALNLISEGRIKAKKYITKILPLDKILDGIMTVEKAQGFKTIIKP